MARPPVITSRRHACHSSHVQRIRQSTASKAEAEPVFVEGECIDQRIACIARWFVDCPITYRSSGHTTTLCELEAGPEFARAHLFTWKVSVNGVGVRRSAQYC
jgi:hypothetical protein